MTADIERDACAEGQHDIVRHRGIRACRDCGYRTQSLTGWLGHDIGNHQTD